MALASAVELSLLISTWLKELIPGRVTKNPNKTRSLRFVFMEK
jgi:hypothetical protein